MKVIPLKKPEEKPLNLKGYRIVKMSYMGMTYFVVQRRIYGFFWRIVNYRPPNADQYFPLMFDKQELALEFIKNIVREDSKMEVTWRG